MRDNKNKNWQPTKKQIVSILEQANVLHEKKDILPVFDLITGTKEASNIAEKLCFYFCIPIHLFMHNIQNLLIKYANAKKTRNKMKKVIKEAREQSVMHITHLLPLSAMLEVIEENTLTFGDAWRAALAYKKALSKPLTLSQFVPCDSEGKPMEKPINNRGFLESDEKFMIRKHAYEQAQKAVLFEWFTYNSEHNECDNGTWRITLGMKRMRAYAEKCNGEYLVGGVFSSTLKALAEHTKKTPLKLKQ